MAVGLKPPANPAPVPGLRLASVSAGIYKTARPDLTLIEVASGGSCSAVFTRNAFAAAPVVLARKHLREDEIRYCLINAGNANAGTGEPGIRAALTSCGELAGIAGCRPRQVLPFSTGVIGEPLPVERLCRSLPDLYGNLREDAWLEAAQAIMTTDTLPKAASRRLTIGGVPVTLTGIAKGAGMIRPDMATMLAFIGTDAPVEKQLLDRLLGEAVATSFNRICVDGDTSTNDACVLLASGSAPIPKITSDESEGCDELRRALGELCRELAQAIVRDGEGASKFITISVERGRNMEECLRVAYALATSPLVKTAFFASDPNWGRILAAVGRAGLKDLDIASVCLYLNDVLVVENGGRSDSYSEEAGLRAMAQEDIVIRVVLNRGKAGERLWTCDLSHDYVRINAEYRT